MRSVPVLKYALVALVVLTAAASLCSTALAQNDPTATAKDVFAKNADAIVKVSIVFRMHADMEGRGAQSRETKGEVIGTIIDPSGLTVVSLFETSPEEQWKSMGYTEEDGAFSAETTDVKIRLATGQEIPAKIVLRDKDLDLTFIRPKTKLTAPAPCVDLSQAAKLAVFDQVININRLGRVAGRTAGAEIARVYAVIEKPRTLYTVDTITPLGTPVFALDGKILGIAVSHRLPVSRSDSNGPGSGYGDTQLYAILPAEDILETAKQAPEQEIVEKKLAPAPAPKPAPAKPAPAKPAPAKPAPKGKS